MNNPTPQNIFTSILYKNTPAAIAQLHGNKDNPNLLGFVSFYNTPFGGILVNAEVYGLPDYFRSELSSKETVIKRISTMSPLSNSNFYGMHIHEFGDCTPPFSQTGSHYNPTNTAHPEHAGDMPPLLSNNGYAWMCFYTGRLRMEDIIGKSVVIHGMRDDFTTQPAGDSGEKIGCGVIQSV